jgi:hypothetical protein
MNADAIGIDFIIGVAADMRPFINDIGPVTGFRQAPCMDRPGEACADDQNPA